MYFLPRTASYLALSLGLIVICSAPIKAQEQSAGKSSKEEGAPKLPIKASSSVEKPKSPEPDTTGPSDDVRQLRTKIDQLQEVINEQQKILAELKAKVA